ACLHACVANEEKGSSKVVPHALLLDANAAPVGQDEAGRTPAFPLNPRAALAVEWLRENYAQGASVEDAAKALRLSRSGLFRVFREHTGQNPKAYLDHLRVEHAKHLLRQG